MNASATEDRSKMAWIKINYFKILPKKEMSKFTFPKMSINQKLQTQNIIWSLSLEI